MTTEILHRPLAPDLDYALAEERMIQRLNEIFERTGLRSVAGGAGPSAWAVTTAAKTKLLDGTFDIDSDTWKCALFQSTSNIGASSTTYAGVTNEVSAGSGYSTGGVSVTGALSGTSTVKAAFGTATFTASGGSIVARFAVIYEVSGNVLAYMTLDSAPADYTIADGNSLALDIATNGTFTLA